LRSIIMLCRLVAAVIALSCFSAVGWAQAPSSSRSASDVGKPSIKKPVRRNDVAAAASGPCHLGVIPIAGNLFLVQGWGVDRVATEGWDLDELVISRVRAAAPGRSVRRVPYTAAELVGAGQRSSFFRETLEEFVQRIARRVSCERYVVVHRHGGNSREFGIGISKYVLFDKAILYAMMKILVYDGRTLELIRQAPASLRDNSGKRRIGVANGPALEIDLSAFPDKPADVARNPILRDGVRALLTQSLDNTLPAMLRL
jgi:hypothetical protein